METTKSIGALFAELGLALVAAERYAEAEEILQKALAEEPPDIDHAQLYEALGRAYEALAQSDAAYETYWILARGLAQLLRHAEAEVILRRILSLEPQDVEALERLGWALFNQQKIAESINAFLEGVQLQPERAGLHSGLGANYAHLGDYPQAREEFERALALDPEDRDALLGLGGVLRELGALDESITVLQQLLSLNQEPPWFCFRELALTYQAQGESAAAAQAWVQAAQQLLDAGEFVGAQQLAERALDLEPQNGVAHQLRGVALYYQSQTEEARRALLRALELAPSAEVYYHLSEVYHADDDPEAALKAVDQALALRPDWGEALAQKGAVLRSLEYYEEALPLFDAALVQRPDWAWAHAERGAALQSLDRVDEALEAFRTALTLRPDYLFAIARLGSLLTLLHRDAEALPILERALALDPGNRVALYFQGLANYNLDRYEEALAAFDAVLEQDISNVEAAYYRGACLRLMERLDDAITALQATVDLEAASEASQPRTYAELGEALRMAGRRREAAEAFKKALDLDADYQWVLARYGETLRALERYQEAAEVLERAIALREDDFWALGSLGATYSSLERQRSAVAVLDRALALRPDYSWAWTWKGIVLRQAYRYAAAIQALDRALELEPQTAWLLGEKGVAFRQSGAPERALSVLSQAVRLDATYAWGWGQLALVHCLLGQASEALRASEQALSQDRALTWVLPAQAVALERLGRNEEAAAAHAEALSDPEHYQAYVDRGSTYVDVLAFDRAIADFERAIQLAPEHPDPYNVLAWFYAETLGTRLEEASALAEQSLALAQRLGDAAIEAHVEDTLGWTYCKRGMFMEALPHLERAAAFLDEDLAVSDHLEFCRSMLEAAPSEA